MRNSPNNRRRIKERASTDFDERLALATAVVRVHMRGVRYAAAL